ncbi:uncharacterized protein LOC134535811 isoform X2 [Bacillus rossius redtenbacheri]|uniref:uncharacterized protein LOC134535811 isoform X2 n=1 Tax=Bacillus rossius redtenbacheri TaxID=93214 RepID=UPI002FDCA210
MTCKILTVFIVVVVSCFVGVHSIYSELVPTAKKMDFHKPYPYGNFPKYHHPYVPEYHVLPFPWFCPSANAPWYPPCACVTPRCCCCYPLCRDAPGCCLQCEDVPPCSSSTTTTTTTTKKPPCARGKHHGGDDKHHQGGKQAHKDECARRGGEDDQWPGDDQGWRVDDPGVALGGSSSWAASAALRR